MEMTKEQDMRNQRSCNTNVQTGTPPPHSTHHFAAVDPTRAGYDQATDGYVSPKHVVVVQPIKGIRITTNDQRPKDLTCCSILACLCCFFPAGIVAICFALEANNAADRNDMVRAHRMNRNACISIIASVVIGVLFCIVAGILMGLQVPNINDGY